MDVLQLDVAPRPASVIVDELERVLGDRVRHEMPDAVQQLLSSAASFVKTKRKGSCGHLLPLDVGPCLCARARIVRTFPVIAGQAAARPAVRLGAAIHRVAPEEIAVERLAKADPQVTHVDVGVGGGLVHGRQA